ncbi:MAG: N-6 DNA methylase [Propionibacteriaceae bacterium]|jgi:hypothetical protein|nr:N-6 DNA methylase [Propionibacteriaceae bacterium]
MTLQPVLFDDPAVALEIAVSVGDAKARGAVFTKASVVEFMLDLLGYTPDKPLWESRLLEPSFGAGGFLFAAAARLVESWVEAGRPGGESALDYVICGVELDEPTFRATQMELAVRLVDAGLSEFIALRLSKKWLVNADFLIDNIATGFNFVVGNPPYVRQELIPDQLLASYRTQFPTMVGRADLYVPFFEKALGLLAPEGRLSFICADAWTKNDYGRALRELVTERFALDAYVDMYGIDAFEDSVGAYPSVTVISRSRPTGVRTATATSTDPTALQSLVAELTSPAATVLSLRRGGVPWLLQSNGRQAIISELESRLGTLEQVGCRVGIGVATGADKVFIGKLDELDVEDSRKLPLAVNQDICAGKFTWHGMGVVNPWDDNGLVDLSRYPRLAAYLEPHRAALSQRHTAKADPARRWYKTIDRVTSSLTWQPKLLVPDIRGDGDAISYDAGTAYPHHNLYFITANSTEGGLLCGSDAWNLQALKALLRSGIARLFIDAYAVRIGGGYLRFQAQYLRRIRLPRWEAIDQDTQATLTEAGTAGMKVSSDLLDRVYGLAAGSLSFINEWERT